MFSKRNKARSLALGVSVLAALACWRPDADYRKEVEARLGASIGLEQVTKALQNNYARVSGGKWTGHGGIAELRTLPFAPCFVAQATIAKRWFITWSATRALVVLDCDGTARTIVIVHDNEGL